MSLLKFGFTKKTVDCNTDGSRDMAQQLDKSDNEIEIHEIAHPAVTESGEVGSTNTQHLKESQRLLRDPANPVESEFIDNEIKLGPVQFDSLSCRHNSGRGFRKEWTESRMWLEYSKSLDKVFCFPCRIFAHHLDKAKVRGHECFITRGYNDWQHALATNRGFQKHELSDVHKMSCEMLLNRKRQLDGDQKGIGGIVSAAYHEMLEREEVERQKNRKYIGKLASVMQLLMRLGLPVRGHRESDDSLHRGNFREIIELIRHSDTSLDGYLNGCPSNAHYLSPESQNSLIEAIGDEVLSIVIYEAQQAEFFSVTMDETTDLSHKEQVTIVIRYCNADFTAVERLLAVTDSDLTTGQALADIMLQTLQKYKFDLSKLVGQSYDGAASMSGRHSGVQTIIRKTAPNAHYNHCRSHSSNLVVVKSCQKTQFGRNFFGILEQLFVMIEGSTKRHGWFMSIQEEAGLQKKAMKALSDTRWNCQGRSVEVVRTRLAAVNETLSKIADESSDRKVIGEAAGLLSCTSQFEFVLAVEFFARLLSPLDVLTKALQGPDSTLHSVVILTEAAMKSLQELRTDLDAVIASARELAVANDISTEPKDHRRRKVSRRIDSGEHEVSLSALDELKRQVLEIVDISLNELKSRFMDDASELYLLVGALMQSDADKDQLHAHVTNLYPDLIDADVVVAQYDLVRKTSAWLTATSLQDRAKACPPCMEELRRLYSILIAVPVTSAGCERVFSKLALIKNKLRSTMAQDRLQYLVLCSVERDVLKQASLDNIVDRFAHAENRRIRLI